MHFKYTLPHLVSKILVVNNTIHQQFLGCTHIKYFLWLSPLNNCNACLYYSATMELYEGKHRWSPAGAPFSSLATERAPSVERLAYIVPAQPTAAAATTTERALTDKHVLRT